ncbi:MAG: hypothetical protein HGA39_04610 [Coriobacteriia bacterium]|nr:hypothetical protein [Coriobacteriia bacterium]
MSVFVLEPSDRFDRRVLQAVDEDDDGMFDVFESFRSFDGERLGAWKSPKMYLSTIGGSGGRHETYPVRFPWVFVFDHEIHRRMAKYLSRWGQIVRLNVQGEKAYWALNVTNILNEKAYDPSRSSVRLEGGLIVEVQSLCFDDRLVGKNGIFRLASMPTAIFLTEDAVHEFERAGCSLPDLRQVSRCLDSSPALSDRPIAEIYEWVSSIETAALLLIPDADPSVRLSIQNGESVVDKWNPLEGEILEREGRRKLKKTDFPCFFCPAMSERAAKALGPLLAKYGEFLPVVCGGEKYFIFNVLEVRDVLDENESVMRRLRPNEPPYRIDKWAFKTAGLGGAGIFRLPRRSIMVPQIFFTGAVLDDLLQPELTGFTYQLLWSAEQQLGR